MLPCHIIKQKNDVKNAGGKTQVKNDMKETKNEREHSSFRVLDLIRDVKEHLGLIIVAEAGHGKSYTAFTLAKEAMQDKDTTVIVLHLRLFGDVNSEL